MISNIITVFVIILIIIDIFLKERNNPHYETVSTGIT
jgi:hypothetical protein